MPSQGPRFPSTAATEIGPSGDNDWTGPSNVFADEGVEAQITAATYDANDHSFRLKATNFGFTIPDGATVVGIVVEIERRAFAGAAEDQEVRLYDSTATLVGDDKQTATAWPGTATIATYGSSSDTWNAGLDSADINSSNFGVALIVLATAANTDIGVDFIRVTVHYTVADADAEVSWAELEVPFANARADVSWAELEVPTADSRAEVSWAELEVPTADSRADVSWAEFEVPAVIADADAEVSWAEFEVPTADSRAEVSWAEFEIPTADSRAEVSWAEFELPNADARSDVSWAEFEVPTADARADIAWAEFEVPTADSRAEVSWAELEVPTADARGDVSFAEFEAPAPAGVGGTPLRTLKNVGQ